MYIIYIDTGIKQWKHPSHKTLELKMIFNCYMHFWLTIAIAICIFTWKCNVNRWWHCNTFRVFTRTFGFADIFPWKFFTHVKLPSNSGRFVWTPQEGDPCIDAWFRVLDRRGANPDVIFCFQMRCALDNWDMTSQHKMQFDTLNIISFEISSWYPIFGFEPYRLLGDPR